MPEPVHLTPGRLQRNVLLALNQASLAISSNLSLEKTLQQIVDSAREVAEARYAALGNFDSQGRLATFVTSGMSAKQVARIAHPPVGRGLLKAILDVRQVVRIPEIEKDRRSVGFPPGHPKMTSFLGLPIVAGQQVFGNLYLTDKIGGEAFSEADEDVVKILAGHAAAAIKNAELYQEIQDYTQTLEQQNRSLAAVNTVARVASETTDLERLLTGTLEEILTVTNMDAGEIFLLDEATEELLQKAHRGLGRDQLASKSRFKFGEGIPGRVLSENRIVVSNDLARDMAASRPDVVAMGFTTYVCVPIRAQQAVIGAMGLAAMQPKALPERDLDLLEAFGLQLGVSVENARLYEEIGRLAILDERSRLGMDLHDGVIQSIYAVGLTLETTRLLLRDNLEESERLLDQSIEGLNDAIRDIRNFILDLRPIRFEGDLEQGLARLVREFRANAMVEVTFDASPGMLARISAPTARAIFMTTQEGLANIARHAKASHTLVEVTDTGGSVRLMLQDDGRGFDLAERIEAVGHGLANMRARAEALGGSFDLASAPGKGTTICLELPL